MKIYDLTEQLQIQIYKKIRVKFGNDFVEEFFSKHIEQFNALDLARFNIIDHFWGYLENESNDD